MHMMQARCQLCYLRAVMSRTRGDVQSVRWADMRLLLMWPECLSSFTAHAADLHRDVSGHYSMVSPALPFPHTHTHHYPKTTAVAATVRVCC
jgi:hypothetical protein